MLSAASAPPTRPTSASTSRAAPRRARRSRSPRAARARPPRARRRSKLPSRALLVPSPTPAARAVRVSELMLDGLVDCRADDGRKRLFWRFLAVPGCCRRVLATADCGPQTRSLQRAPAPPRCPPQPAPTPPKRCGAARAPPAAPPARRATRRPAPASAPRPARRRCLASARPTAPLTRRGTPPLPSAVSGPGPRMGQTHETAKRAGGLGRGRKEAGLWRGRGAAGPGRLLSCSSLARPSHEPASPAPSRSVPAWHRRPRLRPLPRRRLLSRRRDGRPAARVRGVPGKRDHFVPGRGARKRLRRCVGGRSAVRGSAAERGAKLCIFILRPYRQAVVSADLQLYWQQPPTRPTQPQSAARASAARCAHRARAARSRPAAPRRARGPTARRAARASPRPTSGRPPRTTAHVSVASLGSRCDAVVRCLAGPRGKAWRGDMAVGHGSAMAHGSACPACGPHARRPPPAQPSHPPRRSASAVCSPGFGGASCLACPRGRYSPGGDAFANRPACADCPANSTSVAPGAASCTGGVVGG